MRKEYSTMKTDRRIHMNGWFTVEEIDSRTFAISEYRHWEETHSYLVCGNEKALLIDTGLGISNIRDVVDGLTELPVTAVCTHVHWDHIGGHRYFDNIAVHEAEKDWLDGHFPLPLETVKRNLMRQPCDFPPEFSIEDYRIFQGTPDRILHDGDILDPGGRVIQVIHTPGHSPGHCCFYEAETGYLFAGDLIYTGCLDAFYPTTDPVQFYESVKKIQSYSISRILPGHHQLDIPVSLAAEIAEGFAEIEQSGQLAQGSGLFDFGTFQIRI